MMRLAWLARLYVAVVIALGAVVLATAVPQVQFPRPAVFATLLVFHHHHLGNGGRKTRPRGVGQPHGCSDAQRIRRESILIMRLQSRRRCVRVVAEVIP